MIIFNKNTFRNYTRLSVLSLSILLLGGCIKEYLNTDKFSGEIETNYEFGGPVAYGHFKVADLLSQFDKNNNIQEYDESEILYITYEEKVPAKTGENLIDIPDQFSIQQYKKTDIESDSEWSGSQKVAQIDDVVKVNFDVGADKVFNLATFKAGSIVFTSISNLEHNAELRIVCNQLKDAQGSHFEETVKVSDVSGSYNQTEQFPLSGYTANFNNPTIDTTQLQFFYYLTAYNSGAGISTDDSIVVDASMENLDFSFIKGHFGQESVITEDEIILNLDLYGTGIEDFIFEDPRIELKTRNSFGIPLQVRVDSLIAFYEDLLPAVLLPTNQTAQDTTIININYPLPYEYPAVKRTDTIFSDDNGNIENFTQVINDKPNTLKYRVNVVSNKDDPKTDTNQFITDTSNINMDLEVQLPLSGYAENYLLNDTVDLDLSELYEQESEIKKLKLRLDIANGMPVDINGQIYMTDSNYMAIDSLFDEGPKLIVESGEVSGGRVVNKTEKITHITIDDNDLDKYEDVKYAIIAIKLNTFEESSQTSVTFYSDYELDIAIGAEADLYIHQRID